MDYILKLIEDNRLKLQHIETYLDLNQMAMNASKEANITAVKALVKKKRALITSINIIDERVVENIEKLKHQEGVDDLSELQASKYPNLSELKEVSVIVLRRMVDIKKSDEDFFEKIDEVFEDYKNEKGKFDKKKLQAYTRNFFVE